MLCRHYSLECIQIFIHGIFIIDGGEKIKKHLCFSIALAMLAICLMACTPSVVTPPDNTTAREAGQTDDGGNDPAVTGGELSGASYFAKCDCLIGYWPDDYKQQAPGDRPGPDVVPVLDVPDVVLSPTLHFRLRARIHPRCLRITTTPQPARSGW